ncbi:thioredoxin-like protein [Nitzschia inconspicua]|uniref:Thioredoxin-like protein n=1 Tax=Nitzschia inconspicua TaxID=303405 RepID=A0A9K3PC52_9STRA|nr:thioredoxin-like protein [Nitzschia inconspicua]
MTAPPSLSDILAEIQSSHRLKPSKEDCDKTSAVADPATSSSAPIMALYFSSAWCDDSQVSHDPVTNVFQRQHENKDDKIQHLVDLVYISSDTSSEELEGNLEVGWKYIPFDKEELRSNVKRHFGICAKKEMEALGITADQRNGGIPTLILIDVQHQSILQEDAIPHVMGETKLDDPLSHWASLLSENEDATEGRATELGDDNPEVARNNKATAGDALEDQKEAKKQKLEQ